MDAAVPTDIKDVKTLFERTFGPGPGGAGGAVRIIRAPGRVNLIGEHTDYNGGLSLPFAIRQGICVRARTRAQSGVCVRSAGRADAVTLDPDSPPARPYGDWRDFPRGALAELTSAGYRIPSAELEVDSRIPEGAGLSSSAALSVSLCLALLALAGERAPERVWLARLCSRIENRWVGANTGLLDQLACLYGRPGVAVLIDFSTLATQPVPLQLGEWQLVAVDSGETHQLSESDYGTRRRECEEATERLGLESLSQATPGQLAGLPDPLDRRARHVIEENGRVRDTVQALEREDLEAVGRLLDASHASLRDLYDSSTEAVERTVRRLKDAGAAGVRMMGGGFGGSVIALLPPGVKAPPAAIALEPAAAARLE